MPDVIEIVLIPPYLVQPRHNPRFRLCLISEEVVTSPTASAAFCVLLFVSAAEKASEAATKAAKSALQRLVARFGEIAETSGEEGRGRTYLDFTSFSR